MCNKKQYETSHIGKDNDLKKSFFAFRKYFCAFVYKFMLTFFLYMESYFKLYVKIIEINLKMVQHIGIRVTLRVHEVVKYMSFLTKKRTSTATHKISCVAKTMLFLFVLSLSFFNVTHVQAASPPCGCLPGTCAESDCNAAVNSIRNFHDRLRQNTRDEFDDDLEAYQEWLTEDLYEGQVGPAMQSMSSQMAAVAMYYIQAIGMFLDAQTQMETQRLFRELQYEAHQDYVPSDDFCWFGSNVKSLAGSQNKSHYNSLALSQFNLTRQVGSFGMAGADSVMHDYQMRWNQFVDTYCNPRDNNFQRALISGPSSNFSGLRMACDRDGPGGSDDTGAIDRSRFNIDISYTRLIEDPKTLEIDFTDDELEVTRFPEDAIYSTTGPIYEPGNEEDVISMARNLYGHRVPSRLLTDAVLETSIAQKLFLGLRSVIAKRSVAQASFNAIVGLKSSGTTHELGGSTAGVVGTIALAPLQTRRFLGAIVRELMPAVPGATAGNILEYIGYSPSYFSQLEILSKRIYQNPDFYANLYDTPANVSRKKVAMKAIELMVDREIYESQLRREMSISVLLASKLRAVHRQANKGLKVTGNPQD